MMRVVISLAALAIAAGTTWAQASNPPTTPGSFVVVSGSVQEEQVTLRWTAPYADTNSGGGGIKDPVILVPLVDLAVAVPIDIDGDVVEGGGGPGGGACASYQIRYSTSAITTANFGDAVLVDSGVPTPAAPGTTQQCIVTGLVGNTTYYFGIRAWDAQGTPCTNIAAAGPVTTATDPLAPGMIATLAISSVTSTSLNLTWMAVADDDGQPASGPATSYDLRCWDTSDLAASYDNHYVQVSVSSPGAPGLIETATIGNLNEGRTYGVAVRVSDGTSWAALSNIVTGMTTPDDGENHGGGDQCSASGASTAGLLAVLALSLLLRKSL